MSEASDLNERYSTQRDVRDEARDRWHQEPTKQTEDAYWAEQAKLDGIEREGWQDTPDDLAQHLEGERADEAWHEREIG